MGFILAHDIDVCMRDGLAADESPFFDESDTSPWDTWLLLTTHVKEDGPSLSVLLSWVPGAYDEEVDVAASLSATACFFRTNAAKLGILAREAIPDRASRLQNAASSFMERLRALSTAARNDSTCRINPTILRDKLTRSTMYPTVKPMK